MRNRELSRMIMAIVSIFLLFMSCFPVSEVEYRGTLSIGSNVSFFPESLRILENDSFAGTSVEIVAFNEKLEYIGERAFSNAVQLTDVYIPETTTLIGKNAFTDKVLIHGIENSVAQKWAKENGVAFKLDNIWVNKACIINTYSQLFLVILCGIISKDIRKSSLKKRYRDMYIRCMRPKDRNELYPINYRFP